MPSIVSFHRNVGHAVILIILFSIFLLGYPCLSIYPPTFRDHSNKEFKLDNKKSMHDKTSTFWQICLNLSSGGTILIVNKTSIF